MKITYQMPASKSDDLLVVYNKEESPIKQKFKESFGKQNSLDQVAIEIKQIQRKCSYQSLMNNCDPLHQKEQNIKKKVLTLMAQMGLNVFMADYVIKKTLISMTIDPNKDKQQELHLLIDQIIEKMNEIEQEQRQMSQCSLKNKQIQIRKIENLKIVPYTPPEEVLPSNCCKICQGEMEDLVDLLKCKHEFCKQCIISYLTAKINEAKVLEIYCPQENCKILFPEQIIKSLLDDEVYAKYESFKKNKLLEQDETIRWCVRPGCDLYIKGNIFSKIVFCKCGQGICYDCRREEHDGLTCDQALDKYYEQMLQNLIIQKCPKCKAPIQKKEGCNHMTCYQCRFQFCWICRARYTSMHFDSDNCFGCPDKQFSSDEPSSRPMWKKYGGIVFEIFASILMLPFLPFIMMYYAVLGPLKILKKVNRRVYRDLDDCDKFFLMLLGVLLSPILMVLQIFPGSILLLCYKLKYD